MSIKYNCAYTPQGMDNTWIWSREENKNSKANKDSVGPREFKCSLYVIPKVLFKKSNGTVKKEGTVTLIR